MRINHGQRLFRVLARQILLSILQIRIGKVIVCLGRVRIPEEVELENLNRCVYLHLGLAQPASLPLRLAFAHMVFAFDVDVNFRGQLRLRILSPGFHQLLLDVRDSVPACLWTPNAACASMRRKIILDHLAVLHHEPNPLQFGNVGERIASNGNEVCKSPRLNNTHPCWSRNVAGLGQSSLAVTFGRGAQLRVVLSGHTLHGWR